MTIAVVKRIENQVIVRKVDAAYIRQIVDAARVEFEAATEAVQVILDDISGPGNIETVAGIAESILLLAGIVTSISAVAAIDEDVSTVAAISTDVTVVVANAADISTVAASTADVSAVAVLAPSLDDFLAAVSLPSGISAMQVVTPAEYDAIAVPDPLTLYIEVDSWPGGSVAGITAMTRAAYDLITPTERTLYLIVEPF